MRPESPAFEIDFLPEDYKQRCQACRHARPRCVVVALATVAVIAVQFWLEHERARLRRAQSALMHVSQQRAELEAEAAQLRTALAEAEARARQVLRHSAWRRRSDILLWLATLRPKDLWWEEVSIRSEPDLPPTSASLSGSLPALREEEYSAERSGETELPWKTHLRLVGFVTAPESLLAYVQEIRRHEETRGVEIVRLEATSGQAKCLQFEIRIELAPLDEQQLRKPSQAPPPAIARAGSNPASPPTIDRLN